MQLRPICRLLAAAFVVALASPGARAGADLEDCVETAVAAIQKRYEAVDDLRARFEQSTRSVALGSSPARAQTSRGEVQFAKPGRMRWSYEEPEPSLVVSDGETLWIYDPAAREAQELPVGGGYLSGAAIQFLLGEGDILRDFAVTARSCDGDRAELELVPRSPATYEKLRLRAELGTGEVRATEIVDLLGNVTAVAFDEIRVNQKPAADVFRFSPPEGVEVIKLEPPR